MTKPPKMTAALRKEALANVSAKRQGDNTPNRYHDMSINRVNDKEGSRDIEQSTSVASGAPPKTLPKVTLYAHQDVLKALRMVAVEDGVQAQEILRRAVRDYLATRGHTFADLTTGR